MKNLFQKPFLILLLAAAVLGADITITTSHTSFNPCNIAPGCIVPTETGTLRTTTHGYPLAVQQTKTFLPANPTNYAETSIETQHFSIPSTLVNILFWFALLDLGRRALTSAKSSKKK